MTRGAVLLLISSLLPLLMGCDQVSARLSANRGYQAYLDRKFDQAAQHYEDASVSLPNNPKLARNLAYSYYAYSRSLADATKAKEYLDKSIEILTQLLAQFPNDRELLSVLVEGWEQGNQLEKASVYFKERVEKNPKDIDALRMLGIIELKRGDFEASIAALEKRLALTPDDLIVKMSIAQTCWQYLRAGGPNEPTEAVALGTKGYEAAIQVSNKEPKNIGALVYAGLLLRERAKRQTDPVEANKDIFAAEEISKRVKALTPAKGAQDAKP